MHKNRTADDARHAATWTAWDAGLPASLASVVFWLNAINTMLPGFAWTQRICRVTNNLLTSMSERYHFELGTAAGAWSRPLTSIWCWSWRMNGAMPVIPYFSMTTGAFIYKLHGPVFHVGRKHANLITKLTFYYIRLRLLTQISVPLSLNVQGYS